MKMIDLKVVPIREGRGPGVIVTGRANQSIESVFDDMNKALSDFYIGESTKGETKTFVAPVYQRGADTYRPNVWRGMPEYSHTVATDDRGRILDDQTKEITPAQLYAVLGLKRLDPRLHRDWDRLADFPASELQIVLQRFWIYFNVYDGAKKADAGKSLEERRKFLEFVRRGSA